MTIKEMMIKIDPVLFGQAVKKVRAIQKLSQRRLAKKVGQPINWIQSLENVDKNISIATARKLAKSFDMPTSALIILSKDPAKIKGDKSARKLLEAVINLTETMLKVKQSYKPGQ